MPPKKKDSRKESQKEKKKDFVWADDEVELLLNIANDYKVSKAAESVDWESVKSKYGDICDLFIAALPSNNDDITKDFPHTKEQITKQILSSKLKAIRMKFRAAVDSGRKSGHGRVVMIYYELCERVWGGSPATVQIDGGIESTELGPSESQVHTTQNDSRTGGMSPPPSWDDNGAGGDDNSSVFESEIPPSSNRDPQTDEDDTEDEIEPLAKETVKQRREFLNEKLKNYKQEKMKRKLPVDTQLLGCAQEELSIKRRLVEQMDKMDKKYAENMERMSSNMEKLTESIAGGFELMKQMMLYQQPPPSMYQPQPPYNLYMQSSPNPYTPNYSSARSSTSSENFDN